MSPLYTTLVFPTKDPHVNIAKSNLHFLALEAHCRLLGCDTRRSSTMISTTQQHRGRGVSKESHDHKGKAEEMVVTSLVGVETTLALKG